MAELLGDGQFRADREDASKNYGFTSLSNDPVKGPNTERSPVDGEDYLFRIFAMHPEEYVSVYYYVGLDHQKFKKEYDSFGKLTDNIRRFTQKGIFDPRFHKIVLAIVDRPGTSPKDYEGPTCRDTQYQNNYPGFLAAFNEYINGQPALQELRREFTEQYGAEIAEGVFAVEHKKTRFRTRLIRQLLLPLRFAMPSYPKMKVRLKA